MKHLTNARRALARWLRTLANWLDVRTHPTITGSRFRVFRLASGTREVLYEGDAPRDAVTVWEHYTKHCADHVVPCHTLDGRYRFFDGDDCRGEVNR